MSNYTVFTELAEKSKLGQSDLWYTDDLAIIWAYDRIQHLERVNKEWEQLWKPIDDLVRPITPLGGCIGDKAVELITSAMKREPAFWYNPTAKNSVISNASKLRKGTAYLYADWSVPLYE